MRGVTRLLSFFGAIGIIKEGKGKEKGKKKIWIYKDKQTGLPKGDATVSYEDPNGAKGAVDWFNGKPFEGTGGILQVSIAERKVNEKYAGGGGGGGGYGGRGGYGGGGGGGGGVCVRVCVCACVCVCQWLKHTNHTHPRT